jgi:DTW domain-containing protein YfiP
MSLAQHHGSAGVHRPACYTCFKPRVACICAALPRVDNRTGIIVLQHPRERFHPIGTARIARLGLAKVRIESCSQWIDGSAIRDRLPQRTALLYPTEQARELSTLPADERPQHLIVIDGTWFHAKKMLSAHPWLADLPAVGLPPQAPTRYRIRREPEPWCVATIEAIVAALRIIEPQTPGYDALLRCFATMVDRQAAYTEPVPAPSIGA